MILILFALVQPLRILSVKLNGKMYVDIISKTVERIIIFLKIKSPRAACTVKRAVGPK